MSILFCCYFIIYYYILFKYLSNYSKKSNLWQSCLVFNYFRMYFVLTIILGITDLSHGHCSYPILKEQ